MPEFKYQIIKDIAQQAGDIALNYFKNKSFKTETKPDKTLVTQADKECELFIKQELKKHFPDYNILGEEFGLEDNGSDYTFIIDPIDGTTNYTIGLPQWSIAIGLVHKNKPIAGVLFFPIMNDLFYSEVNKGSWCNNKPLEISSKTFQTENISLIIKSLNFSKIQKNHFHIRHYGSCTYHGSVIANGTFELMLNIEQPWDICVPFLLVKEAGGIITDKNKNILQNIDLENKKLYIMANNQTNLDYFYSLLTL